jgi:hypothetical protein
MASEILWALANSNIISLVLLSERLENALTRYPEQASQSSSCTTRFSLTPLGHLPPFPLDSAHGALLRSLWPHP